MKIPKKGLLVFGLVYIFRKHKRKEFDAEGSKKKYNALLENQHVLDKFLTAHIVKI